MLVLKLRTSVTCMIDRGKSTSKLRQQPTWTTAVRASITPIISVDLRQKQQHLLPRQHQRRPNAQLKTSLLVQRPRLSATASRAAKATVRPARDARAIRTSVSISTAARALKATDQPGPAVRASITPIISSTSTESATSSARVTSTATERATEDVAASPAPEVQATASRAA